MGTGTVQSIMLMTSRVSSSSSSQNDVTQSGEDFDKIINAAGTTYSASDLSNDSSNSQTDLSKTAATNAALTKTTNTGKSTDIKTNSSADSKNDVKNSENSKNTDAGKTDKADKSNSSQKNVKTDGKDSDQKITDKTDDKALDNVSDDLKEAAADAVKTITDTIKDELGVSDEDIISAMQTLGMTMSDLLNPDSLTQLVTELTTEIDTPVELLTNENLYSSLQTIIQTADDVTSQLTDDYQMSSDDLKAIIDEMQPKETGIKETDAASLQFGKLNTEADGSVSKVMVSGTDKSGVLTGDTKVTVSEAPVTSTVSEEETSDTSSEQSQEKGNFFGSENSEKSAFDQIVSGISRNLDNAVSNFSNVSETVMSDSVDIQSVIDQISEHMKAEIKPDMTTLEMQLHPQSLGNVSVTVSAAKDGNVVAQFTAANDTVKNAIETQIGVLQQRFEQQGIKIDAIEVTVESHEFEQNLSQNSGSRQEEQAAENASSKPSGRSIRHIDLGNGTLEEMLDDLDSEEKVTAQMMAVNGNQVDYTA